MITRQWLLIPAFEQFVHDTNKGRRRKQDGKRIKSQTVENYGYVLQHLREYEMLKQHSLRIRRVSQLNKREMMSEQKYWRKFYTGFVDFLQKQKGCFDNYIGSIIKILRSFFRYLQKDKLLPIGDFHKQFYVLQEEVDIVTLLPHQLQFLINDHAFHESLSPALQRTKGVFIFGCTVALRYSDLGSITMKDIEVVEGVRYLSVRSIKTDTPTRIRLPGYASAIVDDCSIRGTRKRKLLPIISANQFNKNIRMIAEKAGWTHEVGKSRTRQGRRVELVKDNKKPYRFCDLISSHTMRRTAITTMLMLGMPEHLVRKISGHAANSKAFYRYVNLVQSYMDAETEKVFEKLASEKNKGFVCS